MLLFQVGLAMVVVIFLSCVAWWKATRDESSDGVEQAENASNNTATATSHLTIQLDSSTMAALQQKLKLAKQELQTVEHRITEPLITIDR
ncbi:uncharacterized protein TrAtP1_008196 [Trichoderma atroviride]|uniref:uncharacterized protein n=1 Tax=Hypocrea atroviridis TaxID=63577 RepID=UPI00331D0743|nr:hypothetical protein TrAtP1_008196 [Trichoderma atroviride]